MALIVGLTTILTILYHYGNQPLTLTHTRVKHGNTKIIQQTCWVVEPRTSILVWDKNQSSTGSSTNWKLLHNGTVNEWLKALNDTGIAQYSNINVTQGAEVLLDLQVEDDGWIMRQTLLLQKQEQKKTRCTWIHAEPGSPGWYCTWGCRPLPGVKDQGYWEKEVIFPAQSRNNTFLTVSPKWCFWGEYNLTCASTIV